MALDRGYVRTCSRLMRYDELRLRRASEHVLNARGSLG